MHIDFLLESFEKNGQKNAIVWKNESHTYAHLHSKIIDIKRFCNENEISSGSTVALEGDFTPTTISFLLALTSINAIIVPLTKSNDLKRDEFLEISQTQHLIKIDDNDGFSLQSYPRDSNNEQYKVIRERNHPGLVLFSSGTSGEPKAAVHDFKLLLKKI